jgi:phage protein U
VTSTVTITQSEQLTGISEAMIDLSSVFYHAAEGGQVYAKYIDDAAQEGDTELVEFFKELQEQDAWKAQKAKSLICRR